MRDLSSVKEEIKNLCDIVELIGQFVQLKKVGKNYVGLCPFHSETKPSFTVNPEKQIFHCFGCKKGGDIFKFWMEYHNVSFFEALRDLADRYNVDLSFALEEGQLEKRDKLFEINELASLFFRDILYSPQGEKAREYLKKRGIDEALATKVRLGYAPDSWDSLYKVLLKKGIDIKLAVEAGLLVEKESGNGYYDRFRNRLMFPIFDIRGRVVGFGGRVIEEGEPKYLNTPETPIFQKGNLLYGINFSYKSIREKREVIIVEGYMDWLALKKYGIENAVATLGTALTQNHIRRLKGYADEAIVIFDSDEAGTKAALRSFPLFANEGMPAKVVVLPEGHDPDTFLNQKGREEFTRIIKDKAIPLLDFYLGVETKYGKIKDEEKARVLKNILPNLSYVKDEISRSICVTKIARFLNIREDIIWRELQRILKGKGTNIEEELRKERSVKTIGDLQILSLALFHPRTIPVLIRSNAEILLNDPVIKEIIETIFREYPDGEDISHDHIQEVLAHEDAKAFLREFLERPFVVYEEEEVDQALNDIRKKAYKRAILDALKQKKGDIKGQNELIKTLKGGL